jgi:hypothetical protein
MLFHSLAVGCIAIALAITSAAGRTWTSADGEQSFEGDFIRYNPATGEVTVRMAANTRTITFHADRLSKDDREWLERVAEDPDRVNPILTKDFEDDSWAEGFRGANRGHLRIMKPGDRGFDPIDGRALRISIPRGSHYGSSLAVHFADHLPEEPQSAYFRYHIRLCDHWQTRFSGKLPGFGGTYNREGWGGKPTDGSHGWSARGLFVAYDGDGRRARVPVGFYSYHADMRGTYGDGWRWDEAGWLAPARWHLIEQQIHLNTPDRSDGVISAWVDGRRVYHNTRARFRNNPSLKVQTVWLNVYYGGKTPAEHDLHLDIDNLFIAMERP